MVSLFPWRGGTTGGSFLSSAKMKVAVNRKIVIVTEMRRLFIDAPGWRVIQVGADFLPWIGIWQQEKYICLPSRLAKFLHPAWTSVFIPALAPGNGPAWTTWRRAFMMCPMRVAWACLGLLTISVSPLSAQDRASWVGKMVLTKEAGEGARDQSSGPLNRVVYFVLAER